MAVEAHHLHFFPPQLISNREVINVYGTNSHLYNTQMGFGIPGAGSLTPGIADPILAAAMTANPSDSGLTCNLPAPRKRSRELRDQSLPITNGEKEPNPVHSFSFSFLGEDVSFQIQQQQLEIDRFISQHTDRVRRDLAERRKRHAQQLLLAFELGMVKRLKAKEEEIDKMEKLNWALEEKVKTLNLENHIWRNVALTSDATAKALRCNLDHVLSQVKIDQGRGETDDAQSCCGSSCTGEGEERRKLAEVGEVVKDKRWCRSCGEEEARVVLLPCRHLCVCVNCVSGIQTCPICNCNKKGILHVNMS